MNSQLDLRCRISTPNIKSCYVAECSRPQTAQHETPAQRQAPLPRPPTARCLLLPPCKHAHHVATTTGWWPAHRQNSKPAQPNRHRQHGMRNDAASTSARLLVRPTSIAVTSSSASSHCTSFLTQFDGMSRFHTFHTNQAGLQGTEAKHSLQSCCVCAYYC
jgi:hypothetical protein